jgi:hypothetical protein
MAFTGRLGTDDSQLGDILLGSEGEGATESSFTANAVLSAEQTALFTVDAVLSVEQTGSFTADAEITAAAPTTQDFTADAVLAVSQTGSFAADAVLRADQSSSFTGDAILLTTQTASFTADALTGIILGTYFTADAVIEPIYRSQHERSGPWHEGDDTEADHTLAWSFDRYTRHQNLRDVLIDMDARLTAQEAGTGTVYHSLSITSNAVLQGSQSSSFTADAVIV